jgi:hypothetical protein
MKNIKYTLVQTQYISNSTFLVKYRVFQEGRSIVWKAKLSVILRRKYEKDKIHSCTNTVHQQQHFACKIRGDSGGKFNSLAGEICGHFKTKA